MDEGRLEQLREELGPAASVVLPQLLEVMSRDLPRSLARAREALAAGDGESLANAAHSMKSSSSNLGLDRIRDPASAVEAAGRAGDLAAAGDALDDLEGALEPELQALARWLEASF